MCSHYTVYSSPNYPTVLITINFTDAYSAQNNNCRTKEFNTKYDEATQHQHFLRKIR